MNGAKPHPASRGIKLAILGVVINALFVLVKGTAGILGHSYALVADAIESGSDILTSLILVIALRFAAKGPDVNHPYGHGKAEPLAALTVALMLMGAGVLIIVQSIHNILTPGHEAPKTFTLWILLGVIISKELLYRFVVKTADDINSQAMKADAWHHRSDAMSSLAAFIGIGIAVFMGPGYESADSWAAVVAALIILFNGYRIAHGAVREVMDEAPALEEVELVKAIAGKVPGVDGIEKCFVRKMGFDYYVDIHVEVDGGLSVTEGHEIAHLVKEAIQREDPRISDVLVHIEPAPNGKLEN